MNDAPSTPPPPRLPPVRRARFAAAVMAAVLVFGVFVQLQTAHDAAVEAAETLTAALAKAVAERVEGDFRAVEALLNEAAATVRAGRHDDAATAQRMLIRLEQFPEVRYVGVITADGRRIPPSWPSVDLPTDGVDVSKREYFKRLTVSAPPPLIVGAPVIGAASGGRSLHLLRPLTDDDGRPAGAIIAGINPDPLAAFLETIMVDPQGAAAVIHLDGGVIARAPDHQEKFAADLRDGELFKTWIPRSRAGVARFVAKADGIDKIVAYRVLDPYPLVVTSGASYAAALADWRRRAMIETVAALFLIGALFYWAWRSDVSVAQTLAYGRRLEAAVQARTRELAAARDAAARNADRLRKINAELQRMAMVTAHHLQEPLRPMVSYSQLLENRLQGQNADADDMLAFIRNAAVRLKALLRDFQRYVAALTDEPQRRPTDSAQAAQAGVRAAARLYGPDALAASWDDLPTVDADPALLRDLFRELLLNAAAHRDRSGTVTVRIDCRGDADGWTFRIADDGPGIPPEMRERIFQVFEAVAGRNADSTGLGLPLCRLIVEAHGGDIAVEPSDVGAVIRFRLPAAAAGETS